MIGRCLSDIGGGGEREKFREWNERLAHQVQRSEHVYKYFFRPFLLYIGVSASWDGIYFVISIHKYPKTISKPKLDLIKVLKLWWYLICIRGYNFQVEIWHLICYFETLVLLFKLFSAPKKYNPIKYELENNCLEHIFIPKKMIYIHLLFVSIWATKEHKEREKTSKNIKLNTKVIYIYIWVCMHAYMYI